MHTQKTPESCIDPKTSSLQHLMVALKETINCLPVSDKDILEFKPGFVQLMAATADDDIILFTYTKYVY